MVRNTGNILGELTAEADGWMLDAAFYESRNYRELAQGVDFRFVVGRRGTGKSALFKKVTDALSQEQGIWLLTERPTEETTKAFHNELGKLTREYTETRTITRLTWKIQILSETLALIVEHYKSHKLEQFSELLAYQERHASLFCEKGMARGLKALREVIKENAGESIEGLPEKIANQFEINWLQGRISEALRQLHRRVVFLYDGLDEGWVPTQVATGLLGGLAKAAVEFKENQGVHCLLFVRDNMFRALAEFDGDYTRNIEGNTLRLHWDEESLLNLVALRLRAAFDQKGENNIRVWNRFAQRGLEGMDGFRRCLKLTLYRPRDVIALINGAYQVAGSHDRTSLIDTDIEATATRISQARLNDLFKEYEQVLPGLSQFTKVFQDQSARLSYAQVQALLDGVVAEAHEGTAARDFALLRTAGEAFSALYSVGVLGVQDPDSSVRFCHDGSNTDIQSLASNRTVVIHPCYWRALGLRDEGPDEVNVSVDDEDDITLREPGRKEMADMRLRQLGRIIEELHKIPEGRPGATAFEEWVYSATRYLFAGGLDNIQWKPNGGQVQQRDIVGTVKDASGFWRRMAGYDATQYVIEAKNFRETDVDSFRQAWSYLNPPYGRCLMIVTRSDEDGISEHERALVKEGYDGSPRKLVLLMPAKLLQRALSKMRSGNEKRDGYINDLLNKRLDIFERAYVAQKTPRAAKKA